MSEGVNQADRPAVLEGEQRDLFSKFDEVIHTRETLLANGVEDPFSLVMERVLSPTRAIWVCWDMVSPIQMAYGSCSSRIRRVRPFARYHATRASTNTRSTCSIAAISTAGGPCAASPTIAS